MTTTNRSHGKNQNNPNAGGMEALRHSDVMAHLLDALDKKIDVGEYGRLTFVMVARHFLDVDEMTGLIAKQPGMDAESAQALIAQVQSRGYNPPKRERILEWQSQQDF